MHLRRVLLSLQSSDHVLRGVLWRVRGDWYTLRDAALLHPDGRVVPMDGEVVVHRRNVAFAQVPTYGGEQLRNPG